MLHPCKHLKARTVVPFTPEKRAFKAFLGSTGCTSVPSLWVMVAMAQLGVQSPKADTPTVCFETHTDPPLSREPGSYLVLILGTFFEGY